MVESDANVSKESRNAVGGAVDGLDYWEMIELKRVFEAHGGSGSGEYWLRGLCMTPRLTLFHVP